MGATAFISFTLLSKTSRLKISSVLAAVHLEDEAAWIQPLGRMEDGIIYCSAAMGTYFSAHFPGNKAFIQEGTMLLFEDTFLVSGVAWSLPLKRCLKHNLNALTFRITSSDVGQLT